VCDAVVNRNGVANRHVVVVIVLRVVEVDAGVGKRVDHAVVCSNLGNGEVAVVTVLDGDKLDVTETRMRVVGRDTRRVRNAVRRIGGKLRASVAVGVVDDDGV